MTRYFPVYRDIKDWAILDSRTIHDFTPTEHPIEVMEVLIGSLHYQSIGFNQRYEERRTPIIRWITKKEYERLVENEGTVIW